MEFFNVDTVNEAQEKVFSALLRSGIKGSYCDLRDASGKVLYEDFLSPIDVPGFTRSSVDGYAVRSSDTSGATETIPVMLSLVGKVEMGEDTPLEIKSGECVYVPTGGMLPGGADAMVMIEYTEKYDKDHVAVNGSVAPGKNVVLKGEDFKCGDVLLKAGTVLGPSQMASLAAVNAEKIPVITPLKTAVFSTGDELVAPGEEYTPGKVFDINTTGLVELSKKYGMDVVITDILKDDRDLILSRIREAMSECDMILVSGGSSQGMKDHTEDIFNEISDGGVFTHGLAIKPGKPTILGYDEKTKTFLAGLPGHPVAAMMVFETVIGGSLRRIMNMKEAYTAGAVMGENIACDPGKVNCITVSLERGENGVVTALPVRGKSGLITTLSKADGYVLTEKDDEGINEGKKVEVHLL